uniref:Uncharacterized protein AlNc14C3G433 n=1 Tax=Albugo laibachii Nc14 TaxID=890382 RepID=F0VZV5_9STRA|nr:conserved hypothetical protein [Albugo laibachii Nc14]|eukprot:CCA14326.1 conserved hypothetical protein [Albugo laibachii Nc14]
MAVNDGTIHVRPVRGRGLPTVDLIKRQKPVVAVYLKGAKSSERAVSFPATNATNPEWEEAEYNSMELDYNAMLHEKDVVLGVDVYNNEYKDIVIGTGQMNISKVLNKDTREPAEFSIRLHEKPNGTETRGDVILSIWFGPPIRKAFRAARRASRLLEARDHLVAAVYTLLCGIGRATKRFFYLDKMCDMMRRNRRLSIFLMILMGLFVAGIAAVVVAIAIPAAAIAFFTFPLWILPVLTITFLSAPIWIPALLVFGLFVGMVGSVAFGVGITSHPVRRMGAMMAQKLKHMGIMQRIMYSKSA